jgi:hypothetical protein
MTTDVHEVEVDGHPARYRVTGQLADIRHFRDHRDLIPDAHRPIGTMPNSARFAFVERTW